MHSDSSNTYAMADYENHFAKPWPLPLTERDVTCSANLGRLSGSVTCSSGLLTRILMSTLMTRPFSSAVPRTPAKFRRLGNHLKLPAGQAFPALTKDDLLWSEALGSAQVAIRQCCARLLQALQRIESGSYKARPTFTKP